MTTSEPFNLAGFALEGAQAQLGKAITDLIKYQFAFDQLNSIHYFRELPTNDYPCVCNTGKCPTLAVLRALSKAIGTKK